MPRRSIIGSLPPEVKDWLDKALVENNFSGYQALARELERRGFSISHSSVHRYGQQFEERLARLKIATEQARAVAESVPDDQNMMGDALMRLVQQKSFEVLMDLEDPGKISLTGLGTMISKLTLAGVQQKKWMTEMREKARIAAEEVTQVARAGGLTDQVVEQIRSRILGIAS